TGHSGTPSVTRRKLVLSTAAALQALDRKTAHLAEEFLGQGLKLLDQWLRPRQCSRDSLVLDGGCDSPRLRREVGPEPAQFVGRLAQSRRILVAEGVLNGR